jgi:hypothetical protein
VAAVIGHKVGSTRQHSDQVLISTVFLTTRINLVNLTQRLKTPAKAGTASWLRCYASWLWTEHCCPALKKRLSKSSRSLKLLLYVNPDVPGMNLTWNPAGKAPLIQEGDSAFGSVNAGLQKLQTSAWTRSWLDDRHCLLPNRQEKAMRSFSWLKTPLWQATQSATCGFSDSASSCNRAQSGHRAQIRE